MIIRMDNINNETELKNFFIEKELVSHDGKILPIDMKKVNLFLSNNNMVFHSFYSTYKEAAITYFPYIVSACFYRGRKVLYSFLQHCFSNMNVDNFQYSLQDLEKVANFDVEPTEIATILSKILHKKVTPQKIIEFHDSSKKEQNTNKVDPFIHIMNSRANNSSYLFFLKVFEPYLEVHAPQTYKKLLFDLVDSYTKSPSFNDNYSILKSDFHLLFESYTPNPTSLNGKFSHHLAIEQDPNFLFHLENKNHIKSHLFRKDIVKRSFFNLNNSLFQINKMYLANWIFFNKHLPTQNSIFPENILSNSKYNNYVKDYFLNNKNHFHKDDNKNKKIFGVLLKMILINHKHLDLVIKNNILDSNVLNKIVKKVTDKIESDTVLHENDLTNISQYVPVNLLRRECLEEFFFNLNNILEKYPHLKNDLSISTRFFKSDERFEYKNIDLFLFRTPSYKKLLQNNPHAFHPRAKIAIEHTIDDFTLSFIYTNAFINQKMVFFMDNAIKNMNRMEPPSSILRNIYFDFFDDAKNTEFFKPIFELHSNFMQKYARNSSVELSKIEEIFAYHLSSFHQSINEEKEYQSFSFLKNVFKKVLMPDAPPLYLHIMDLLSSLEKNTYLNVEFGPNNSDKPHPAEYILALTESDFSPLQTDVSNQITLQNLLKECLLIDKLSHIEKDRPSLVVKKKI